MGNVITCQSTLCRYAQGGVWASSNDKNPMYIGTNSAGTYKYIGQWHMPAIGSDIGEITSVMLHVYRNSSSSSTEKNLYIGCSSDSTDSGSVQSTGVTFALSAGEGWKSIDVSGIAEHIIGYTSTWYLLIGNPNRKNTYAEVAGYGSGKMLYLEIICSNGSKIYLASGGELVPYQLYRAENGELVRYDLYRGENGSLIKY